MRHLTGRLLVTTALLGAAATAARAQFPPPVPRQMPADSVRAVDTIPVPPFRVRPPISPLGAFGRSLLIPGWGQAVLGRRVTGAFFVFWEGLTITMALKARHQLDYFNEVGTDEQREAKLQEIEDWVVLLVFNHLFAGLEAFVSAYLWDFPVELERRALPGDRVGVGARIPIR
jgi:hypothetical protein